MRGSLWRGVTPPVPHVRDLDVFVDLKLHDIPTTVHKAARVLGAVGARYVTLHAQGGAAMVRAGVEGSIVAVGDGAAGVALLGEVTGIPVSGPVN